MAGLSLKHIYKIYPGRETASKKLFRKKNSGDDKKRSGDFVAVKDFNMEIEDGEFIVFVGPSGCGKSTTLRMIAGLEEITGGEMFIGDTLVNDVSAKDRDIAMVFQSYALYPHMTSYQNIAFGLKMRKIAVEKTDANGKPVLAIDIAKVRDLKRKIKEANADLRYAEIGEIKLFFGSRISELESELEEQKKAHNVSNKAEKVLIAEIAKEKREQNAAANTKKCDDEGEIKQSLGSRISELESKLEEQKKVNLVFVETEKALSAEIAKVRRAQSLAIEAKKCVNESALEAAENAAKEVNLNLADIKDSEIKLGIIQRKTKYEQDLKYFSETPVQVYDYKHMPKEDIDEKVKWAAEILGITELLDSKPSEMSGGQRQRIALGRAMVRGPKVFLLDEPLSNLDAKLRTTMRSEIVKLHKQLKTTFIYVTHDQIEAMTMGTRIVVMKLGVVQQIDTPTNLFDYPENKFVAGFIGTPQMNFFDVTAKKAGTKLEVTFKNGQKVSYSLSKLRTIDKKYLDGAEHSLTLGVRGENMRISESGLQASVSIKEVLGNTTQLFINLDGYDGNYIVCLPARNGLSTDDKVCVAFNEENIHLFDCETEHSVMQRTVGNN